MGLSIAMSELRTTRLTLINDVKWCIEMVQELESGKMETFHTKEQLISELKSVLESVYGNIN